jgi:hypothetical protein
MRLAFFSLFLTLVVVRGHAAPNTTIPPSKIQTKETFQNTNSEEKKESVQATEAPPYNPRYIRQAREISTGSLNGGVGYGVGSFDKDKGTKELTTFHLQRTQYNSDETAQEFGVTVTSNGLIGADWGFKKFCCFATLVGSWKPYYKLGAAAFYDPKDQLANFIDYQRYFAQVAAGFENPLAWDRRIRLEVGARSGYPGSHFFIQVLYSFPD